MGSTKIARVRQRGEQRVTALIFITKVVLSLYPRFALLSLGFRRLSYVQHAITASAESLLLDAGRVYVNWYVNWYRKAEKLDSAGVRRSVNCSEEGLDSEAISCGTVNITSKWGIMENVGGNHVTGFHPLLADVWEVCLAAFSSDITGRLFSRLSSSKVFLQGRKSISPFHTLYKGQGGWVCSFLFCPPFSSFTDVSRTFASGRN